MSRKRKVTGYLIVDVHGGMRVVKNVPRTSPSEVVVQIDVTVPTPPKIAAALEIDLPEPPDANVEAIVAEWGPVEEPEPTHD